MLNVFVGAFRLRDAFDNVVADDQQNSVMRRAKMIMSAPTKVMKSILPISVSQRANAVKMMKSKPIAARITVSQGI